MKWETISNTKEHEMTGIITYQKTMTYTQQF